MSRRRQSVRWLVTAGAVLGVLGTATGAAGASPAADAARGGSVPLRVATYNIHAGAGMDNVFDLDRTAAELRSLHADVIGLEEVDVHWDARSEWRDMAAELAQRTHMHVYFAPIYDEDPATEGAPRRQYGVAVLSRYAFRSAQNHELTRLSTQDPNPVPARAPGFPEVVVKVRGVPVHVYVTHLDYRADPAVRVAQVADTRRIMAEDCGPSGHCPRQILVGDFNASPDAPEIAPLWQELRDAGPDASAGAAGYTYPADKPVQRIDYVTGSRDAMTVRKVTVPETLASDHRPVVADISLRRG
ncbi:endonuclease/exonuclease/phosphatase family protein [Streptomyces sp. TS71-3]|uniref:endonuclease/exonuclease/phosphatase family protein n=1 Tax=Streptomyces sp. TS71-3 TaxID=2733862 RepID=UPI001B0CF5B0|nr:endonuclease/exonuclease/phosphatase family protein [Streptomyces sp. TS71-3]GHJ40139.1 metal-dependent hydrolase [Streptomyces sp. TS71-3]